MLVKYYEKEHNERMKTERDDRKRTFNEMLNKSKSVVAKMEQLFNEVNSFTKSHQTLEKENNNLQSEAKALTTRNQNLTKENNKLKNYLKAILKAIKHFFRELVMNLQKKLPQLK